MAQQEYKVVFYGSEIAVSEPQEPGVVPHPTVVPRAIVDKITQEADQGWELVSLVPVAYKLDPEHEESGKPYFVVDYYAAYFRKRRG